MIVIFIALIAGALIGVGVMAMMRNDRIEEYESTGYTPEEIRELERKHWDESRQIALYDDEIQQMKYNNSALVNDCLNIIIGSYTFDHQREIFVEECAEAIHAAQKCKRQTYALDVPEAFENFKEEIADVAIMIEQMKRYIGQSTIDKIIEKKLLRQVARIQEGEADEMY